MLYGSEAREANKSREPDSPRREIVQTRSEAGTGSGSASNSNRCRRRGARIRGQEMNAPAWVAPLIK